MRAVGLEPARHRRFRLQRPRAQPRDQLRAGAQPGRDDRARPRGAICCSSRITIRPSPGRARPTTASASRPCWRSPQLLRGRALARPVTFLFDEGEEAGPARRPRLPRARPARRPGSTPRSTSRRAALPGRRSCSRPAGRTAPRSRSTAPRPRGRSPIRSRPTFTRLIPNSTDVAVFDARPWTILNFAVIGNETRYHSAGDTLAALDRRSLQHMGEQALAATELAAAGAVPAAAGERLYTDVLGRVPDRAAADVRAGAARRAAPLLPGRRLAAAGARPALAGDGGGAGRIGRARLRRPFPRPAAPAGRLLARLSAGDDQRRLRLGASLACVLALLFVAGTRERTRLRAAFWLLFTGARRRALHRRPGRGDLFPAAAARRRRSAWSGKRWFAWAERAGAIVAALLLYLTFGPALGLFEELMNGGPLWAFAPLGAAILLPVLIELRPLVTQAARRPPRLALIGWLGGGAGAGLQRRPAAALHHRICLGRDARARRGSRSTMTARRCPSPPPGQRTEMPYTTRRRWAAPAPAAAGRGAGGRRCSRQQPVPGGRRLRLRIADQRRGERRADRPARGAPPGGGRRRLRPPLRARPDTDKYYLRCIGRACDGAVLDLIVGSAQPVDVHHRRHAQRPAAGRRAAGPRAGRRLRAAAIWPGRDDCDWRRCAVLIARPSG